MRQALCVNRLGLLCRIMVCISLLGGLASCGKTPEAEPGAQRQRKVQAPLEVRLSMTDKPAAGAALFLTLTAVPLIDAPSLKMTFALPDGLTLLSAVDTWEGAVAQGGVQELRIRVLFPDAAGHYEVMGLVSIALPDGTRFTQAATLTLSAAEEERVSTPKALKRGRYQEPIVEFQGRTR